MFVVDPNPTFWAPVTVRPLDAGGEPETFRARFRALTAEEYKAFEPLDPEKTRDFVAAVLVDAGELVDMARKPLAFDETVKAALNSMPHVRLALVEAYHAAFTKAARGN